jgi:hypothetical protein
MRADAAAEDPVVFDPRPASGENEHLWNLKGFIQFFCVTYHRLRDLLRRIFLV